MTDAFIHQFVLRIRPNGSGPQPVFNFIDSNDMRLA